jgi:hypothetical protein
LICLLEIRTERHSTLKTRQFPQNLTANESLLLVCLSGTLASWKNTGEFLGRQWTASVSTKQANTNVLPIGFIHALEVEHASVYIKKTPWVDLSLPLVMEPMEPIVVGSVDGIMTFQTTPHVSGHVPILILPHDAK